MHDWLGPVAVGAHLRGRSLDIVGGSAEADLAALVERPGRAWIPVERRADASGVHQQRPVRSGSPELLVAVAEQNRTLRLTVEHPLFARLRFRREALDIGARRAVADEDAVQLGLAWPERGVVAAKQVGGRSPGLRVG